MKASVFMPVYLFAKDFVHAGPVINALLKKQDVENPHINTVLKEWALYMALPGARPKIKELHMGGGTPNLGA